MEIIEYGEDKVNMLMLAVKRLYEGLAALKLSIDTLNENIFAVRELLDKIERDVSEAVKSLHEERDLLRKEMKEHMAELEGLRDRVEQQVKLVADVFLEKIDTELSKAAEAFKSIPVEVAEIRSRIKEYGSLSVDAWHDVKSEVLLLRGCFEELQMSIRELAMQVKESGETTNARIRELELLVADLASRVARLEETLKEQG